MRCPRPVPFPEICALAFGFVLAQNLRDLGPSARGGDVKTRVFIVLATLWASQATNAADADWRIYGFAKTDGEEALFYLSSDVRPQADGRIQFWVKGLDWHQIDTIFNSPEPDKSLAERAAKKVLAGYVAPYAVTHNVSQDEHVNLIVAEEIANEAKLQPITRILYELDCKQRLLRELSMEFTINGKQQFSKTTNEWTHIAPETNGAVLEAVLCPAAR
jgi:hypothetical protein